MKGFLPSYNPLREYSDSSSVNLNRLQEIAKSLPSITELSDIIGRGIKDALDFVQDIFGAVTGFIKKKVLLMLS